MTTIRINERTKEAKAIINMLKAFDFVEVVEEKQPIITKEKLLNDFKKSIKEVKAKKDLKPLLLQGFKEIKAVKSGTLKAKTLKQSLNGC